jgi:antitoxin YefM
MLAANFTELRKDLKKYLDIIEENDETLIVKRGVGKGTVLMSLDEYNSLIETVHLLSTKNNASRLFESVKQIEEGNTIKKNINDLK